MIRCLLVSVKDCPYFYVIKRTEGLGVPIVVPPDTYW